MYGGRPGNGGNPPSMVYYDPSRIHAFAPPPIPYYPSFPVVPTVATRFPGGPEWMMPKFLVPYETPSLVEKSFLKECVEQSDGGNFFSIYEEKTEKEEKELLENLPLKADKHRCDVCGGLESQYDYSTATAEQIFHAGRRPQTLHKCALCNVVVHRMCYGVTGCVLTEQQIGRAAISSKKLYQIPQIPPQMLPPGGGGSCSGGIEFLCDICLSVLSMLKRRPSMLQRKELLPFQGRCLFCGDSEGAMKIVQMQGTQNYNGSNYLPNFVCIHVFCLICANPKYVSIPDFKFFTGAVIDYPAVMREYASLTNERGHMPSCCVCQGPSPNASPEFGGVCLVPCGSSCQNVMHPRCLRNCGVSNPGTHGEAFQSGIIYQQGIVRFSYSRCPDHATVSGPLTPCCAICGEGAQLDQPHDICVLCGKFAHTACLSIDGLCTICKNFAVSLQKLSREWMLFTLNPPVHSRGPLADAQLPPMAPTLSTQQKSIIARFRLSQQSFSLSLANTLSQSTQRSIAADPFTVLVSATVFGAESTAQRWTQLTAIGLRIFLLFKYIGQKRLGEWLMSCSTQTIPYKLPTSCLIREDGSCLPLKDWLPASLQRTTQTLACSAPMKKKLQMKKRLKEEDGVSDVSASKRLHSVSVPSGLGSISTPMISARNGSEIGIRRKRKEVSGSAVGSAPVAPPVSPIGRTVALKAKGLLAGCSIFEGLLLLCLCNHMPRYGECDDHIVAHSTEIICGASELLVKLITRFTQNAIDQESALRNMGSFAIVLEHIYRRSIALWPIAVSYATSLGFNSPENFVLRHTGAHWIRGLLAITRPLAQCPFDDSLRSEDSYQLALSLDCTTPEILLIACQSVEFSVVRHLVHVSLLNSAMKLRMSDSETLKAFSFSEIKSLLAMLNACPKTIVGTVSASAQHEFMNGLADLAGLIHYVYSTAATRQTVFEAGIKLPFPFFQSVANLFSSQVYEWLPEDLVPGPLIRHCAQKDVVGAFGQVYRVFDTLALVKERLKAVRSSEHIDLDVIRSLDADVTALEPIPDDEVCVEIQMLRQKGESMERLAQACATNTSNMHWFIKTMLPEGCMSVEMNNEKPVPPQVPIPPECQEMARRVISRELLEWPVHLQAAVSWKKQYLDWKCVDVSAQAKKRGNRSSTINESISLQDAERLAEEGSTLKVCLCEVDELKESIAHFVSWQRDVDDYCSIQLPHESFWREFSANAGQCTPYDDCIKKSCYLCLIKSFSRPVALYEEYNRLLLSNQDRERRDKLLEVLGVFAVFVESWMNVLRCAMSNASIDCQLLSTLSQNTLKSAQKMVSPDSSRPAESQLCIKVFRVLAKNDTCNHKNDNDVILKYLPLIKPVIQPSDLVFAQVIEWQIPWVSFIVDVTALLSGDAPDQVIHQFTCARGAYFLEKIANQQTPMSVSNGLQAFARKLIEVMAIPNYLWNTLASLCLLAKTAANWNQEPLITWEAWQMILKPFVELPMEEIITPGLQAAVTVNGLDGNIFTACTASLFSRAILSTRVLTTELSYGKILAILSKCAESFGALPIVHKALTMYERETWVARTEATLASVDSYLRSGIVLTSPVEQLIREFEGLSSIPDGANELYAKACAYVAETNSSIEKVKDTLLKDSLHQPVQYFLLHKTISDVCKLIMSPNLGSKCGLEEHAIDLFLSHCKIWTDRWEQMKTFPGQIFLLDLVQNLVTASSDAGLLTKISKTKVNSKILQGLHLSYIITKDGNPANAIDRALMLADWTKWVWASWAKGSSEVARFAHDDMLSDSTDNLTPLGSESASIPPDVEAEMNAFFEVCSAHHDALERLRRESLPDWQFGKDPVDAEEDEPFLLAYKETLGIRDVILCAIEHLNIMRDAVRLLKTRHDIERVVDLCRQLTACTEQVHKLLDSPTCKQAVESLILGITYDDQTMQGHLSWFLFGVVGLELERCARYASSSSADIQSSVCNSLVELSCRDPASMPDTLQAWCLASIGSSPVSKTPDHRPPGPACEATTILYPKGCTLKSSGVSTHCLEDWFIVEGILTLLFNRLLNIECQNVRPDPFVFKLKTFLFDRCESGEVLATKILFSLVMGSPLSILVLIQERNGNRQVRAINPLYALSLAETLPLDGLDGRLFAGVSSIHTPLLLRLIRNLCNLRMGIIGENVVAYDAATNFLKYTEKLNAECFPSSLILAYKNAFSGAGGMPLGGLTSTEALANQMLTNRPARLVIFDLVAFQQLRKRYEALATTVSYHLTSPEAPPFTLEVAGQLMAACEQLVRDANVNHPMFETLAMRHSELLSVITTIQSVIAGHGERLQQLLDRTKAIDAAHRKMLQLSLTALPFDRRAFREQATHVFAFDALLYALGDHQTWLGDITEARYLGYQTDMEFASRDQNILKYLKKRYADLVYRNEEAPNNDNSQIEELLESVELANVHFTDSLKAIQLSTTALLQENCLPFIKGHSLGLLHRLLSLPGDCVKHAAARELTHILGIPAPFGGLEIVGGQLQSLQAARALTGWTFWAAYYLLSIIERHDILFGGIDAPTVTREAIHVQSVLTHHAKGSPVYTQAVQSLIKDMLCAAPLFLPQLKSNSLWRSALAVTLLNNRTASTEIPREGEDSGSNPTRIKWLVDILQTYPSLFNAAAGFLQGTELCLAYLKCFWELAVNVIACKGDPFCLLLGEAPVHYLADTNSLVFTPTMQVSQKLIALGKHLLTASSESSIVSGAALLGQLPPSLHPALRAFTLRHEAAAPPVEAPEFVLWRNRASTLLDRLKMGVQFTKMALNECHSGPEEWAVRSWLLSSLSPVIVTEELVNAKNALGGDLTLGLPSAYDSFRAHQKAGIEAYKDGAHIIAAGGTATDISTPFDLHRVSWLNCLAVPPLAVPASPARNWQLNTAPPIRKMIEEVYPQLARDLVNQELRNSSPPRTQTYQLFYRLLRLLSPDSVLPGNCTEPEKQILSLLDCPPSSPLQTMKNVLTATTNGDAVSFLCMLGLHFLASPFSMKTLASRVNVHPIMLPIAQLLLKLDAEAENFFAQPELFAKLVYQRLKLCTAPGPIVSTEDDRAMRVRLLDFSKGGVTSHQRRNLVTTKLLKENVIWWGPMVHKSAVDSPLTGCAAFGNIFLAANDPSLPMSSVIGLLCKSIQGFHETVFAPGCLEASETKEPGTPSTDQNSPVKTEMGDYRSCRHFVECFVGREEICPDCYRNYVEVDERKEPILLAASPNAFSREEECDGHAILPRVLRPLMPLKIHLTLFTDNVADVYARMFEREEVLVKCGLSEEGNCLLTGDVGQSVDGEVIVCDGRISEALRSVLPDLKIRLLIYGQHITPSGSNGPRTRVGLRAVLLIYEQSQPSIKFRGVGSPQSRTRIKAHFFLSLDLSNELAALKNLQSALETCRDIIQSDIAYITENKRPPPAVPNIIAEPAFAWAFNLVCPVHHKSQAVAIDSRWVLPAAPALFQPPRE